MDWIAAKAGMAVPERWRSRAPDSGPAEVDWSALMARGQAGDKAAYARLLHEIVPYLRSLARRHLGSAADVEDAVQEILITVHAIRHTYDPARPFGPWLATIASRRLVDALRHRSRRLARETELVTDLAEEATDGVDPAVLAASRRAR